MPRMRRGIDGAGFSRISKKLEQKNQKKQAVSDDATWDKIDFLVEMLGEEEFILATYKGMGREEADSMIDFLFQTYDLGREWSISIGEEERDEDEDY